MVGTPTVGVAERLMLRLDEPPLSLLLRGAAGYSIGWAWLAMPVGPWAQWTFVPFFLGALLAMRLGPTFLRKVLPFTETVRAVWNERRQLAKRFDSYQWQKLLPVGVGLYLHVATAPERFGALQFTAYTSIAAGLLGFVVWRHRDRGRNPTEQPALSSTT